jgi:hypothetical protein
MKESAMSELEFQLRKLNARYSGLFEYHEWPSEHARWLELIFALVTRISSKPEEETRDAIEELDRVQGLLDVEALSRINQTKDGTEQARRILEWLSELGFAEEEARNSILAMHEAAQSVMEHHQGKIQKYLRKCAHRMIDELSEQFSFTKIEESDVKFALAYWMQNTLNMPVTLSTNSVDTFCERLEVSSHELVEEADRCDMNVAVVDDMIDHYIRGTEENELS